MSFSPYFATRNVLRPCSLKSFRQFRLVSLDVNAVYVLMRAKRNRTPRERLAHMCSGPVFRHLREIDANFLDRVRIVTGDLEKPSIGIEDASIMQTLKEGIHIVIHAAADVRFNEPLYDLILCNLCGTRELLELAKQMRRLEVFVYMSTAFSNCKASAEENIAEEFYSPPMDADILIDYVQNRRTELDRDLLGILSPNVIKPWPNNYTFSKALSESMVRRYGDAFPICVIRPTISTFFEFKHFNECVPSVYSSR